MRGPNPLNKFKNIGAITVPYGGQTREEGFHPGVDVANEIGTPIPATAGGVVTKVDNGHVQGENNFGNTLEIRDGEGNTHQYHHLQGIDARPGQMVQQGQQVATMGNTGSTYSESGKGDGAHLDYRIVNAYGRYRNPSVLARGV
jgi:murein DD-endopeptidase MepM/ murein hydrolase activator NlpD